MDTFYVCEETLHMLHLTENIELIHNESLEHSYYNIMNKSKSYEWDIIHVFKNYDFYITSQPKTYPPCSCPFCMYCTDDEKKEQIRVLRTVIYIKEFINTVCDYLIDEQMIGFIKSEKGRPILKRIEEYYDYLDQKGFRKIKIWPEKDKYFQKIFGMPPILYKAGVDEQFYKMRKESFFESEICGNARASHGWFWESLIDMSELCEDGMNKILEGFNVKDDTV